MAIKVNRFNVRYKGVSYGPGKEAGQIIEGLSEEEESRLIAGSNGTIENYVVPVVEFVQTPAAPPAGNNEDGGTGEADTDTTDTTGADGQTSTENKGEGQSSENIDGNGATSEDPKSSDDDGNLEVDPDKVTIDDLTRPVEDTKKSAKKLGK